MRDKRFLAVLPCLLATSMALRATPCDGVSRILTPAEKAAWAPAISRQMGLPSLEVLQVFRDGDWRIVYVGTKRTDPAFLFYRGDPRQHRYIDLWAGAAMEDEEDDIRAWTAKRAPGFPARLAACFAWHVTKHRDL